MPDLASFFVFPFLLVFMRLSSMLLIAPGFSDIAVSAKVRVLIAVAISFIMFPIVADQMPTLPNQVSVMVYFMFVEIIVGICLGIAAKLFMGALNIGGEIIAYTSGFQAATLFDPSSGANTTAITLFLMMCAGVLMFVMNIHHLLLRGVLESYQMFPAGTLPDLTGSVAAIIQVVSNVFSIGVQISAPVLVVGLLGYVVLGVFNRLIPQLQVFFVAMPVTITVGLLMLAASLSLILGVFMINMQDHISLFGVVIAD